MLYCQLKKTTNWRAWRHNTSFTHLSVREEGLFCNEHHKQQDGKVEPGEDGTENNNNKHVINNNSNNSEDGDDKSEDGESACNNTQFLSVWQKLRKQKSIAIMSDKVFSLFSLRNLLAYRKIFFSNTKKSQSFPC